MGYESNIITPMDFSGNVVCSGENDNKKKLGLWGTLCSDKPFILQPVVKNPH